MLLKSKVMKIWWSTRFLKTIWTAWVPSLLGHSCKPIPIKIIMAAYRRIRVDRRRRVCRARRMLMLMLVLKNINTSLMLGSNSRSDTSWYKITAKLEIRPLSTRLLIRSMASMLLLSFLGRLTWPRRMCWQQDSRGACYSNWITPTSWTPLITLRTKITSASCWSWCHMTYERPWVWWVML